jgi:hypothetical protein
MDAIGGREARNELLDHHSFHHQASVSIFNIKHIHHIDKTTLLLSCENLSNVMGDHILRLHENIIPCLEPGCTVKVGLSVA